MTDTYWLLIIVVSIGLLGLLSYFTDPVHVLSKLLFSHERKLKEMLPSTPYKSKKLFVYALFYDDENIYKVARRGALFQWVFAFFCSAIHCLFVILAVNQKSFFAAAIIALVAGGFLYWGIPFFRLWLSSSAKNSR